MLLELVREERLGAAETLVDAMVQSVEQKQALNNPYGSLEEKDRPRLYDTFERNWYEGYAAGFLAKTALGGAASSSIKNTIKSTTTAQKVGSNLADTKALRALSRVSDAKEAAKGRATARILLTADGDAAEPLLSSADTAGGVYRLWQLQRGIDADVDTLPETRQEQLGRFLSRSGGDGQQTFEDLASIDSEAADALVEIDTPDVQRRFVKAHQTGGLDSAELSTVVKRYDGLDPDEKALAQRSLARSGDDGVRLLQISICNSPCDSLLKSVDDLADRQGLTAGEKDKLVAAFEESDNVPDDAPGGDPEEVYQDLAALDSENVDGLDETIGDISGDRAGYTGLAGESRVANDVIDSDDAADIEIREQVDPDEIPDDDIPSGLSRGEDLKQGPTDIDVNDRNGPAYESKNTRDFTPLYPDESAYESLGNNLNDLRVKLNTLAASGQDEIVVVMRESQLNAEYSDEVVAEFPDQVENVDRPTKLTDEVEKNFDDVTVEFKSFEEVGE